MRASEGPGIDGALGRGRRRDPKEEIGFLVLFIRNVALVESILTVEEYETVPRVLSPIRWRSVGSRVRGQRSFLVSDDWTGRGDKMTSNKGKRRDFPMRK